MLEREIKRRLPNASKDFVDLNSGPSGAYTEPNSGHGTLAKSKTQKGDSRKCMVSIVSYRVRLADVDGCIGKWHLDALRYAGAISDDTEEAISYKISQKKVQHKVQEKTLIEIVYPDGN